MERAGAAAAAVGAAVTFLRRTTKKERVTSHGTRVKKKKSDQRFVRPLSSVYQFAKWTDRMDRPKCLQTICAHEWARTDKMRQRGRSPSRTARQMRRVSQIGVGVFLPAPGGANKRILIKLSDRNDRLFSQCDRGCPAHEQHPLPLIFHCPSRHYPGLETTARQPEPIIHADTVLPVYSCYLVAFMVLAASLIAELSQKEFI